MCPQGAGAAATWTSNLSILMAKFPERKSTVKAWCDASFNFGLTIGPVLGALMYDAGGFFLPFAVTGTAILLSGLVVLLITEVSHNLSRCLQLWLSLRACVKLGFYTLSFREPIYCHSLT